MTGNHLCKRETERGRIRLGEGVREKEGDR